MVQGYKFIVEPGAELSLPIDQSMFEYIMGKAVKWGSEFIFSWLFLENGVRPTAQLPVMHSLQWCNTNRIGLLLYTRG